MGVTVFRLVCLGGVLFAFACAEDDDTTGSGGQTTATTTTTTTNGGGTTASASSTSAGTFCTPGSIQTCYTGPAGTEGVGACAAGTQVCDDQGAAFGACLGDIKPMPEQCETVVDDDCDGVAQPCSADAFWSKRFGGQLNQVANGIMSDATGNAVVVGSFDVSVDFGGGQLTAFGHDDAFVAKLGADGAHLWSKRFGNGHFQTANAVAIDAAGNIVVAGSFRGAIDLGGGQLDSAGVLDVFVAKLDPNGNHVWSKRFGDADDQLGQNVAVDDDGNVLLSTNVRGSVDFGDGPFVSGGDYDAFLTKLDPDGNHLWTKQYGDSGLQLIDDAEADPMGNLLATGTFEGTVDFGDGMITSTGAQDVFVVKLDPMGNHLWSKFAGDAQAQSGTSVAVDTSANVVVSGAFDGIVDFGGGALEGADYLTGFIVKLDAAGNHVWSRVLTANYVYIAEVAMDGDDVLLGGHYYGPLHFGDGPVTDDLQRYAFVTKLDGGGELVWHRGFDSWEQPHLWGLAVDPTGDVFCAGQFSWDIDFGNGVLTAQDEDIFVAKLNGMFRPPSP